MNNKSVPNIRFKGFSKEWEEKELGVISIINPKSELPEIFEYVDLESVVGTEMLNHRQENKYTAPSRAQRLAEFGDLFYQTVRPYQKNNYLFNKPFKNYVFSTGYAQIRPYGNGSFLLSIVQRDEFVKSVLLRCTGTSYPAINSNDLGSIKIYTPKKDEQSQIGNFFLNIDSLITTQQNKISKLKNIKSACLDKMFPKKGATTPEIRFKGFSGDWEDTILSKIAEYENGKAHENEISERGKYIVVNSKFISSEGYVKKYSDSAHCMSSEKDILMVLSDVPNGKAIAKCFYVDINDKYTVNQRICKISSDTVDTCMLYYLINRNPFFLSFDDGVKQTNLRKEDVLNLPLIIPKDITEQFKLGELFNTVDKLIQLNETKLSKLKNIKTSFLNKMFVTKE